MALTAISPALPGSRNEQQRLQTMLTVLTQTCRAVIEHRGKAVPDCWVWSSRAAACSAGSDGGEVA
jgi:hypothetical protein